MKVIRNGQTVGSDASSRPFSHAQKAAISAAMGIYIELTCGHFTTREVDKLYRRWRPSPLRSYCETCGKWQFILTKEKPEVPQEPLF